MNKKYLAVGGGILGAVLLIALVLVLTLKPFSGKKSEKGTVVTVESLSAKAGKTVKIPVRISGNPGAMGFLFEFEYDSDKLTYVNFEKGNFLSDGEVANKDGKLRFVAVEDNDVKKDGVLVYLNFKVKAKASGKANIKVVYDKNSICNYNEEGVPFTAKDGVVTVK